MQRQVRTELRGLAPELAAEVDELAAAWLKTLLERLGSTNHWEFRPKQINDPIWGTIELAPWEVALLDTALLQRMRGVRQLGLAQLVFPGAGHDRLEHILGVVGAVEQCVQSLARQIDRWNRDHATTPLPAIEEADRYALRLAALLHDTGHGPFSHAIEPVMEMTTLLGRDSVEAGWRVEIGKLQRALKGKYTLNAPPSASEVVAVMIVLSEAMTRVLAHDKLMMSKGRSGDDLQEFIVSAIIGAVEGPGATYLSSLISSQIDADKLDYLPRDAHHAGLDIGFDTDRLLSRLEVLRVTPANVDRASLKELHERASASKEQMFLQLGIAASGFGSFEQMLIGRTFLYDRLYHHHKVRSAEAMAQRLLLVAERDRGRRFTLKEIFLGVGDDTMLRILAGEVTHSGFAIAPGKATELAKGVLERSLFHRAFAFRARFIADTPGLSKDTLEQNRRTLWRKIESELETLPQRYDLGRVIFDVATECAKTILGQNVEADRMRWMIDELARMGPEQIIVDLPKNNTQRISTLARYPNGAIKIPEFSFNPQKWSDAYELQKRTGYVFCPRSIVEIAGLASKIVFLKRFGVIMGNDADGYIKAPSEIPPGWIEALCKGGLLDEAAAERLVTRRQSLLAVAAEDLAVPEDWIKEDADIPYSLAADIGKHLRGGLTAEDKAKLTTVLQGMYAFVDLWFAGHVTTDIEDEAALQILLRDSLRARGLEVDEGSRVGGGNLDLWVEDAVLIENKFHGPTKHPTRVAAPAGMQGRRYAISLGSQVVVVVVGHKLSGGDLPNKSATLSIHGISSIDPNRVEFRFSLPYGAPLPSRESEDPKARRSEKSDRRKKG
ncbi:HD domain-containing protein [Bradyrhizobium tunisiense]|uniref:HD domain-containing protein n=1 Tax=Bradyrhizobium tunisiense TaxID=3278709 RepID=UPI0035E02455